MTSLNVTYNNTRTRKQKTTPEDTSPPHDAPRHGKYDENGAQKTPRDPKRASNRGVSANDSF